MSRAQLTSTVEQNSAGAASPFVAGKNKIINGDFGIWQRGTSFTANGYTADRWRFDADGSGSTNTISQQAFTPGTAPVAGYEGAYFYRMARSAVGTGNTYNQLKQAIEDVRTFAGQTVTLSFWAKADTTRVVNVYIYQNFGTGGSSTAGGYIGNVSLTTSWARYSITTSIASISGSTIGTGSYLQLLFATPAAVASTIDFWGVQLEAGSVTTPFTTASNTLQGELALCQRYYYRNSASNSYSWLSGMGIAGSTTVADIPIQLPVTMRTTPTVLDTGNIAINDNVGSLITATFTLNTANLTNSTTAVRATSSGLTLYRSYNIVANNNAAAYIGFSAEL